MNHASVVVEMLLLQVPYNVPIIPTFGSARRVAPRARRHGREPGSASDAVTDQ
jgi:hypothetical protein